MHRGRMLIFLALVTLVGIGVLAIGFGFYVANPQAVATEEALQKIYYAAQNIPKGTSITQEMLGTFSIPPENVAEVMLTVGEESALVGQIARYDLDPGVIITSSMVESTLVPSLQSAFLEVDRQFQESIKSNIVYNAPQSMNLDDSVTIELLLNPSLSQDELATQLIEQAGLSTSTAEPGLLTTDQGGGVTVVAEEIEVTNRMKAILTSIDPEAFVIQQLSASDEQVVSLTETTKWRWSITAKKEGTETLVLTIYRLVKYDDKEFWHEVETYKENIDVSVTVADKIKSLDWKWFAGFVLALVGSILSILKWRNDKKKEAEEEKPSRKSKKKKKN